MKSNLPGKGGRAVRPIQACITVFIRIHSFSTVLSVCLNCDFYVHHSQMLAKAAVMYDAKAIRKQITCLKQRVCTAADAADGGARA